MTLYTYLRERAREHPNRIVPVGGQDRRTAVTAIRQGPCGKDPTGGGALLHPDRAGTAHGRDSVA